MVFSHEAFDSKPFGAKNYDKQASLVTNVQYQSKKKNKTAAKGKKWLWLLLIVTIPPDMYEVVNMGVRQVAYVIAIFVLIGVAFIYLHHLPRGTIGKLIYLNPYVVLYCLMILLTQLVLMVGGKADLGVMVNGLGYIIVTLLAFFIIAPALTYLGLVEHWWLILMSIGTFASGLGILSTLGLNKFLGISLVQSEFMGALGFYSTRSFLWQRTAFGAIAFLGCLGAAYFLAERKRVWLALISLAICTAGVFLSWGRGVWLGLSFAILIWLYGMGTIKRKLLIVIGTVSLVISIFLLLQPSGFFREMAIVDRGLSGREYLWPFAVKLIREQPITGYGIGSALRMKVEAGGGLLPALHLQSPSGFHNFILDTAFTVGVPATIFMLLIFAVAWIRLRKIQIDRSTRITLLAGVAGIFVISFFTTYNIGGIRTVSFAFAVILGLASAYPLLEQQPDKARRIPFSHVGIRKTVVTVPTRKKTTTIGLSALITLFAISVSIGALVVLVSYYVR